MSLLLKHCRVESISNVQKTAVLRLVTVTEELELNGILYNKVECPH